MKSCKQVKVGKSPWVFFWTAISLMALVSIPMAEPASTESAPENSEGQVTGAPNSGGALEAMNPKLLRELNLTPEQQKKFREVHLAMQKRKIQLQSEKAICELDLKNVLTAYPVNKAEAMKAGEKVADAERKLTLLKVESWSQFQAGLTAEQHRKLQDIQADLHARRQAWREEIKNQRRENKREEKRQERMDSKHK